MRRREFIGGGLTAAAGFLAFGPTFWRQALAAPAQPGAGPYGALQAPDANGLRLPQGFTAREIARAGQPVPGTAYPWHIFPDGQATFATDDGGWILVSNSESLAATGAGVSAIRFTKDGAIDSAYRICAGTNANCAGGPTPWGTWLTCEEYDRGQVFECDPLGVVPALSRPALGVFNHEAVAVDPVGKRLYLTEDEGDGGLYRFTPANYPNLNQGVLEIAKADANGRVTWTQIPDPSAIGTPTRQQVDMTPFDGGEGIWFDSGLIIFSTKGDDSLRAYDTRAQTIELLYAQKQDPQKLINGPDNLSVAPSGDLFVCEDNGDDAFQILIISAEREVAPVVEFVAPIHAGSETAGVVFDPSGTRMYFASQRGNGNGTVYEVTGPFRKEPPGGRVGFVSPPTVSGGRGQGGAGTTNDTDAPGLRIDARRRIPLNDALRRGVPVAARVAKGGRVDAALTTSELRTVPGERGSTPRPRTVTLDRARGAARDGGTIRLRLRLDDADERRLRRALARARRRGRRTVSTRLIVQLRDAQGNVAVANRRVELVARSRPARRRRRRARGR